MISQTLQNAVMVIGLSSTVLVGGFSADERWMDEDEVSVSYVKKDDFEKFVKSTVMFQIQQTAMIQDMRAREYSRLYNSSTDPEVKRESKAEEKIIAKQAIELAAIFDEFYEESLAK